MTHFGASGPRPPTAPPDSKGAVTFDAPAPCCGINARWSAVVTNTTDLSRTKIEYEIGCDCLPAEKEIA